MFLPHLDDFCDQFLNRRTATWNLFVSYNEGKIVNEVIYASVLQLIISENQSICENNQYSTYIKFNIISLYKFDNSCKDIEPSKLSHQ